MCQDPTLGGAAGRIHFLTRSMPTWRDVASELVPFCPDNLATIEPLQVGEIHVIAARLDALICGLGRTT